MKAIKFFVQVYFVLLTATMWAQDNTNKIVAIIPDSISICYAKTTNLIFPFAVKSVDKGSQDILAQKAKGIENILQIKAAQQCFPETNLSVITADGKLYSFLVNYNEEPEILNYELNKPRYIDSEILFAESNANEAILQKNSKLALVHKAKFNGGKDDKYSISFRLDGLYIKDEVMYFRIQVENRSNINYSIDQLRFFIRDKKKSRRTASQELEVTPIYIHNLPEIIGSNSESTLVFAVPKFTIPDKKYLAIQLVEKNGGRHLELKVKDKKLEKVIVLP